MMYKASYLYQSGSIECGDCIYADSDADAALMAKVRAKVRRAENFGLHEVTGHADDGTDLIRPVPLSQTGRDCVPLTESAP